MKINNTTMNENQVIEYKGSHIIRETVVIKNRTIEIQSVDMTLSFTIGEIKNID